MSRELSKDFEEFIIFLKEYELAKVFDNPKVIEELKKVHKKYFSYLTLISELEQTVDEKKFKIILEKIQFSYLAESSSDVGSSIFHSANGSYKSARMLLRSSIETFFKGFCKDEINGILQEKRIFKIFDSIRDLNYFQKEPHKSLLATCLQEYSELCKDIHTADELNMQKLSALKYFPSYDQNKMDDISARILKLLPIFLFFTCDKFNAQFQQMHHRNRENIVVSVQKAFRPIIVANKEL